jgi:hypothetical protein
MRQHRELSEKLVWAERQNITLTARVKQFEEATNTNLMNLNLILQESTVRLRLRDQPPYTTSRQPPTTNVYSVASGHQV